MNEAGLINTSTLAKLYRTTTGDIEKKLTAMGHKPVRTVVQQSGRRFMVWNRKAVIDALDAYKQRRLETLQERERMRQELTAKQHTIPRTGYASPDVHLPEAPTDFVGLDNPQEPTVPLSMAQQMLEQMKALQEHIERLEKRLGDKEEESAP